VGQERGAAAQLGRQRVGTTVVRRRVVRRDAEGLRGLRQPTTLFLTAWESWLPRLVNWKGWWSISSISLIRPTASPPKVLLSTR